MNKEYTKNCPKCNKIMGYKLKKRLNRSIKNNYVCIECSYENKRKPKEEIDKRKKEYLKGYYLRNKEKIKKYCQKPEIEKIKIRNYINNRRKDPIIRMNHNISGDIRQSLKSRNLSKNGRHWEDIVGYSAQDLKEHLESLFQPGMTWENHGRNGWHIDHKIPKVFFKYTSTNDVEFKMCWRLENFQPLWENDNIIKGDKIMLWGKEVNAKDIKQSIKKALLSEQESFTLKGG